MRLVIDLGAADRLGFGDANAVALAVRLLKETAILPLTAPQLKAEIKSLRRSGRDPLTRKRLEVLYTQTPLDQGRRLEIDYSIAELQTESDADALVELALDDEYTDRLALSRRAPGPGTTREKAFAQIFARHVGASHQVVIFDRYLGLDLVQAGDRCGAYWFLGQLEQHGCRAVDIMTATEKCTGQEIEAAARGLLGSTRQARYTLMITEVGSRMHDRHIRFNFGNTRGSEAIALGPGLGAFKSPRLNQSIQAAIWQAQNALELEDWFKSTSPVTLELGSARVPRLTP